MTEHYEAEYREEAAYTAEYVEAKIKPEQEKNVTPGWEPTTVTPDAGCVLSRVNVAGMPEPTEVVEIGANGDHHVERAGIARVQVPQGVFPSGAMDITENADGIDVTNYERANVRVPVGVFPEGTLDITENGPVDVTNYQRANVQIADIYKGLLDKSISGDIINTDAERIAGGLFASCSRLTGVIFTKCKILGYQPAADTGQVGVSSQSTFAGCASLKKVILPALVSSEGVSNICGLRAYMFYKCTNLKLIIFNDSGGSGNSISGSAFLQTPALKTLIIRNYLALGNTNAFSNSGIAAGTGYVYFPDADVATAKAAMNWATFASQIRSFSEALQYDSNKTYTIGEICQNNGKLYAWINNTDGNSEPTLAVDGYNADWFCVANL